VAYEKDRGASSFTTELVCYLLEEREAIEGFDFVPPVGGGNGFGRYEIDLLCLAMMHFHFGLPKLTLEVNFMSILILMHALHFLLVTAKDS